MKLFTFDIDRSGNIPIYKQLYNYICLEIKLGNIAPYEKLPSRRALSKHLNISKNTIDAAYQLLLSDGYIVSMPRSGYYAASNIPTDKEKHINTDFEYKHNFSIHHLDTQHIPYKKWNKAAKSIKFNDDVLLKLGESFGDYPLRAAIAKFLRETKGINCSADNVVIGAGDEYLLHCLDKILGADNIYGIESPCHLNSYTQLDWNKNNVRLIDMTPCGIDTDELYSSDVTTLYSMPDHHIPTGFTMDNDTRRMVLEWAYKSDNRYIIEDSYDSFYQYGDKRLAPLFSMDTMGRVIYLCPFARILSSAIRVSFIVLPDSLVRRWSKTHRFYRCLASRLEQAIILEFISRGYLHKQIVTMKEIYKAKRDFLTDRLMHSALANNIKIINADAGTHFLINYRSACTQVQLVEKAKNSGIKILPLSHYFIDEVSNRYNDNIFVMGFGGMSELEMTDAVRLLEQAWTK